MDTYRAIVAEAVRLRDPRAGYVGDDLSFRQLRASLAGDNAPAGSDDEPVRTRLLALARLTARADHALALVETGLGSALTIAGLPAQAFAEQVAGRIDANAAAAIHQAAKAVRRRVALHWMRLRDVAAPSAGAILGPRGRSAALRAQAPLAKVDYQAIFGPTLESALPHDASAIGPGAYFADLMATIEQAITAQSVALPSALSLDRRRPDLGNMLLTPGAATEELADLELILDILEASIAAFAETGPTIAVPAYPDDAPGRAQLLNDWPTAVTSGTAYTLVSAAAITVTSSPALVGSITLRSAPGMTAVTIAAPIVVGAAEDGATTVELAGFDFRGSPGPVITLAGGSLCLSNCVFSCPADAAAGGGAGWAIACADGASMSVTLSNCTFVAEGAAGSAAIDVTRAATVTLDIVDSIFWPGAASPAGSFVDAGADAAIGVAGSDIRGGKASVAGASRIDYANTNFDADPVFDPSTLRLNAFLPGSPCIGRGVEGGDVGATIDLYQTLAWAVYPNTLPFDRDAITAAMALEALGTDLDAIDLAIGPIVTGANGQTPYFALGRLGLGVADYQILTYPLRDAAVLAPYLSLPAAPDAFATAAVQRGTGAPLAFVAADAARWLGLTPTGMRDLINQDLGPAEIAQGIGWSPIAGLTDWAGFFVNGRGDPAFGALALVTQFVPVGRYALAFAAAGKTGIAVPAPAATDSFTLSFWMHAAQGQAAVLATLGSALSIDFGTDCTLTLTAKAGTTTVLIGDLAAFAADPQWVYLAAAYSSPNQMLTLFVNGTAVAAAPLADPHRGWATGPVSFGADQQGGSGFTGLLAELTIWSRALDAADLATLFRAQPMPSPGNGAPADLILYLPVNDGPGGSVVEWVSAASISLAASEPAWAFVGLPANRAAAAPRISVGEGGAIFVRTDLLIGRSAGTDSGVTIANLDRMNRFVRLATRLGWSFSTLDWALFCATRAEGLPVTADFDDPAALALIADLGRIAHITARSQVGVNEACAMFGPLKPFGTGAAGTDSALFDQVFNRPPLSGAVFSPTMDVSLPVATQIDTPGPIARRLAAVLNLTTDQLAALIAPLAPDGQFALTGDSLTALFRYRMLATMLGTDVDGIHDLLALWPLPALTDDVAPAAYDGLLATVTWIRQIGAAPGDLLYLVSSPSAAPADTLQRQITLQITQKLPVLKADLAQAISAWLVGPDSFISPIVDEGQSHTMFAKAVDRQYLTPDGVVRAALLADLPQAPYLVPSETYATLGQAVRAAVAALNGGTPTATVLIAAGLYTQVDDVGIAIELDRGRLVIQSQADATTTIVDGGGKANFLAVTGRGGSVLVTGLTIRNGYARHGGAIQCGSALTLESCLLLGNTGAEGGAINMARGGAATTLTVSGCVFWGNHATGTGGALHLSGVSATLSFTTIAGNTASATDTNGAYLTAAASLDIAQSILWNQPVDGERRADWNPGGFVTASFADVNWGADVEPAGFTACINLDPKLDAPTSGSYTLGPTSPCLGKASDGGDIGFGGWSQQDLLTLALYPFAYAQLGALQRALAGFFGNDTLPMDVVLLALGPHENGLELLQQGAASTVGTAYLRDVYRYLLLASRFGMDGATLSAVLTTPCGCR